MTEKYSVLKQACIENSKRQIKEFERIKECNVEYSKKYKRKINRINREIVDSNKAIYTEVDNAFERIRSKIVRKCKKLFNMHFNYNNHK